MVVIASIGPDAGIDRLGNRFRSHGRHDEEERVDKHFSSSRNQVTKRGRKGLELSLHSVSETKEEICLTFLTLLSYHQIEKRVQILYL